MLFTLNRLMKQASKLIFLVLFAFGLVFAQDENPCVKFGSCSACENSGERCGWCASDSYGGGICLEYDGVGNPIGTCAPGYWNYACCSQYDSCDECSNSGTRCQWCEYGSLVNGGQCIPYNGQGSPVLGGCDANYYTNWCCRDYDSCDSCLSSGDRCEWCAAGSSVNGGECLPYNGQGSPMYGGCEANYYLSWCCEFSNCSSCINGGRCGWCGNSTVNAYTCLQYNGQGYPMIGGCSKYYTNDYYCPVQSCPTNCVACDNPNNCIKCVTGFTGTTCNQTCPAGCETLTGCDIDSGECFGCNDGGKCGFACEEDCLLKYYGCKSCSQSCGDCLECEEGLCGNHCQNICEGCLFFQCDTNGLCESGCAAGYSGNYCNITCSEQCRSDQICGINGCECAPGYVQSSAGDCIKANLGISCDECNKLVSTAKLAFEVGKTYETLAEAQAALETISCFFLPPPLDIGCALLISQEGALFFVADQITEALLQAGFCDAWGACP